MKEICSICDKDIESFEIYGDWYHCSHCNKNLYFQPDSSKREDSVLHNIPEWGSDSSLNFDEWQQRCGARNPMET